jgi:hypothetical protein
VYDGAFHGWADRIVRVLLIAMMVAGLVGFLTMLWFVLAH